MDLGPEIKFWLAAVGGAAVRLLQRDEHPIVSRLVEGAVSVFAAWAFTGAVLDLLGLNPDVFEVPVAALLALTASGILQVLLDLTDDPKTLIGLLRAWLKGGRGK